MPNPTHFNRRDFVKLTSAGISAALLQQIASQNNVALSAEEAAKLPTAAEFIPGKDKRLVMLSAKTGEIETPLELLREHKITPKELLFVRNNQVLADTLTLKPSSATDWEIKLNGLIESEKLVNLEELKKLPQHEVELVLQCSGNGRKHFEKSVKAEGAPWQNGAMGNVKFGGVALKDIFEHLKVKIKPEAKFLAAEGKDAPPKADAADFEHSIPLSDALDRSLLALEMNGEPIPLAHGGPVRLITPGFYGTMNVKWVNKIRFEEKESSNHHHVGRYRTPLKPIKPGEKFTSTLENSEPNWNMRIKSEIFNPLDGAKLAKGKSEIRGVAWNDGLTKIEAVEVSSDGGKTWRRADVDYPKSPFAWHHWKLAVEFVAGPHTILSRAIDVAGRAQPLDGSVAWNPAGYAWNGVGEVSITVDR